MTEANPPPPGSPAAVALGCIGCWIMRGTDELGRRVTRFEINPDCPLHAGERSEQEVGNDGA